MIVETISLWLGRIFVWSLLIATPIYFIYWSINKYSIFSIGFKALIYHISSFNRNLVHKDNAHKVKMQLGRKWWVRHKNKWYLFECTKIEEVSGR